MGSSRRFIVLCLWTIREYMRSAYCNSGVRVCSCARYYVPRIQFIIYLYWGGGGYTETKPLRRSNIADFATGA